jgi:putative ABC transport system permease protein
MAQPRKPRGTKRVFRFLSRTKDDVRVDVRDEFAFHIEMRVADLMHEGLSEAAAHERARREFGDAARGAAACIAEGVAVERRHTITRLIEELRQDVSFGIRLIRRNPGFSAVAILTLAVAIGGNAAIFSLVNALALMPLPVRAPQEIVRVYSGQNQMSWPNYHDLRDRSTVVEDLAAHGSAIRALTIGTATSRAMGEIVSPNYLTLLGVPPLLGRTFTAADSRADVIVLSERTWRTRYASDPQIVGRRISLNSAPYEVVGVMPRGFRGVRPPGLMPEFWLPVNASPTNRMLHERSRPAFEVIGRLANGRDAGQALAEMQVLAKQLDAEYPDVTDDFAAMEVFPVDGLGRFRGMRNTMAPIFLFVGFMTIVTGFVLLVGCANIAGLLLGRGTARRREIAVRLALGARRGRLIRQLLAESLVLALIGGAAGIVLALWLGTALNGMAARLPFAIEFDLGADRRILAYTIGLSILTCLLCGLAPSRHATRLGVVGALKDDDPGKTRQRFRSALVVGQVTVSCLLLLWGGLFLRSLMNVHRVDPGFDPSGVVVASVSLDDERGRESASAAFAAEALALARDLPGAQSAGISSVVPLSLTGREEHDVRPDGDSRGRRVMRNRVTPGWLETMRIPLLAGRDFRSSDGPGSAQVAIVNDTAARLFWNGDAVGHRVDDMEVIGVVRDSKYWTLGETIRPLVYSPVAQRPFSELNVHVRTADIAATTAALRQALHRLAPDVFVEIQPLSSAVSVAIVPAQVGAALTGAFGALAALLAMMGVYGLVSLTVAQRTREIGIRKAIGASTTDIVRLAVRGSLTHVALGLGLGTVLGSLGARLLGGFIVGVSPMDPLTLMATMVLVIGTAAAASALPALRAAKVDALSVLKAE